MRFRKYCNYHTRNLKRRVLPISLLISEIYKRRFVREEMHVVFDKILVTIGFLPVFIASRIPSIPPFRKFISDSTPLSILPPVLLLSIFYVRDQPRKSLTVRSRSEASSSRLPSGNISLHPVLVVQSEILSPTRGLPSFNIPPFK